jgi:hypothetical protein
LRRHIHKLRASVRLHTQCCHVRASPKAGDFYHSGSGRAVPMSS